MPEKIKALLLLGPTGAGKTPLGEELEKRSFLNRKAHHFDFGALLRKIASGEIPFLTEEKFLIQTILKEGRLLKEEEFYLAEKILLYYLAYKKYQPEDWLVLNGLPRNLYQAKQLERLANIRYVVHLNIDFSTLKLRLRFDPAGDRKEREDDIEELVEYKLTWFKKETFPLLDYYQQRARIINLPVKERDSGEDLFIKLSQMLEM
ncbi:MAG: adenylate kinase family protein [Caldimicrobium sp.]